MNKRSFLLAIICLNITIAFCNNSRKLKSVEAGECEILTPRPGLNPLINGAFIYGCWTGHPFLYRIPYQGERPISFSAEALPKGLILDPVTGIITGNTPEQGEYNIVLNAKNKYGKDKRSFKIVAAEKLALTPPMGWNHWYAHFDNVTDKIVRDAADIMISSGMADVGYQYANIDDCWMNAPNNRDSLRVGPLRDEMGNIIPNRHFPDMKGLADYIHHKGLKAGLYSSPGPLTGARFAGSYQHEAQDARQFAEWGFDFLKYDWCSYKQIALAKSAIDKNINPGTSSNGKVTISLESFQYPFRLMGDLLKQQDRDIVYNCNTEVIDVNQDPLGESASVINHPDSCFIMVKNLFDGSKAVGFFNRGERAEGSYRYVV